MAVVSPRTADATKLIGGTVNWAFVFRGTRMTALVGMSAGILSVLVRR